MDRPIADSELERLHNAVEDGIGGRTLADLREHFARSLDESRDELAELRQLGLNLVSAAIAGADRGMDIVIEGQARLMERPDFASTEHLKELIRVLEDRERLVMLLDRTLGTDRVQVFLSDETSDRGGYPVSLVAAPFQESGRPGGAVGIIGPTRMDYQSVVPLVSAAAGAVTAALSRGREPGAVRPSDSDSTPDSEPKDGTR